MLDTSADGMVLARRTLHSSSHCIRHNLSTPASRWTRDAYMRQMRYINRTGGSAALISVADGVVNGCLCSKPAMYAWCARRSFGWLMQLWDDLLPLVPLPRPVTVIASLHDYVAVSESVWATPVLTIEQGGNRVSLPTFNAWQGGWNHTMPRTLISRGAGDSVAWSDRKPQLVWRGTATSYGALSPRRMLLQLARLHPGLIDARSTDTGANLLSMERQAAYKYAISLPGMMQAYAWRVPELFLRGFLVFHVRGPDDHPSAADPEWMCGLRPYVHFIPVQLASNGHLDTGQLLGALAWARAHDQKARDIASQGRDFVRRLWRAPRMAHELSLRLRAAPHHPGMLCQLPCVRVSHVLPPRNGRERRDVTKGEPRRLAQRHGDTRTKARLAAPAAPTVLVLVTSSPRPSDPSPELLRSSLASIRAVLYPTTSAIAKLHLLFDGVKEDTPGVVAAAYRAKMSWADTHVFATYGAKVFRSTAWLHKHGLLQLFLARHRPTPLLFVLEEDSAVRGPINVAAIHRALLHPTGEPVEHVRLSWNDDCLVLNASDGAANFMSRPFPGGGLGGGRMHISDWPCAPHSRSVLLHRTDFWSDRPHWATWRHYATRVLPAAAGRKGTPERLLTDGLGFASKVCRLGRFCWVYGVRGHMHLDLHLSTDRSYNNGNVATISRPRPGGRGRLLLLRCGSRSTSTGSRPC